MLAQDKSLLTQRGPVGETVLSWCVLSEVQDNPLGQRAAAVADFLIEDYPEICEERFYMGGLQPDEIGPYDGETTLHLAVVQRNLHRIRSLLEAGNSDVQLRQLRARAYGSFFSVAAVSGEGAKGTHGARLHCYYGELPLSFAAALGYTDSAEEMLRRLDPELQIELLLARDSCGNTAAHVAVLYGRMPMLEWLFQKQQEAREPRLRRRVSVAPWRRGTVGSTFTNDYDPPNVLSPANAGRPGLLQCKNSMGLTPLTVAALQGDPTLFRDVVTTMRRVLWTFGDVTCYTLPLKQIETHAEDGEECYMSILSLVVSEQLAGIISHELVLELFQLKWQGFARVCFAISIAIHTARMTCLMFAAHDFTDNGGTWDWEIAVLAFGLEGLLAAAWDHILALKSNRQRTEVIERSSFFLQPPAHAVSERSWQRLRRTEDKVIPGITRETLLSAHLPMSLHAWLLVLGNLLAVLHFVFWATDYTGTARFVMAICLITQWIATVEYCTVHHRLGVLGIVIDKVVRRDMTVYVFFLTLVIVGFAEALYVLEVSDPEDAEHGFLALLLQLYRVAVGEKPTWSRQRGPNFPNLVFALYIVFSLYAFIVLLRLLICMFNRTEAEVQIRAMSEMRLRWARFVLRYERRIEALYPKFIQKFRRDFFEFKTIEQAVPNNSPAPSPGDVWGLGLPTRTDSFSLCANRFTQVARMAPRSQVWGEQPDPQSQQFCSDTMRAEDTSALLAQLPSLIAEMRALTSCKSISGVDRSDLDHGTTSALPDDQEDCNGGAPARLQRNVDESQKASTPPPRDYSPEQPPLPAELPGHTDKNPLDPRHATFDDNALSS